jgi:replication initiation and membrane attachment protein DnaB
VIQILSTLKDKEFNSTEALRVAVSQAMGGRDYFIRQLWPLIERNAGVFDGYLINEAALTKLKQTSEFPAAVIDELRLQGTQYFKEKDDFDKFLKELSEKVILLSDDERNILPMQHWCSTTCT